MKSFKTDSWVRGLTMTLELECPPWLNCQGLGFLIIAAERGNPNMHIVLSIYQSVEFSFNLTYILYHFSQRTEILHSDLIFNYHQKG